VTKRSRNGLRVMDDPFVVARPRGMRIRTRLQLSLEEEDVLFQVGDFLGSLASKDLATRCKLGKGPKHLGRKERKQALTKATSARWAGAITRVSDDQWERGYKNLIDQRQNLKRAIEVITARLAASVASDVVASDVVASDVESANGVCEVRSADAVGRRGSGVERRNRKSRVKGYHDEAERHAKRQRLTKLQSRLEDVEARITAGRVSVCRGGGRLAKKRHHLADGEITEAEWREEWRAMRMFLIADGEADKLWGNETIRVNPDTGELTLRLPTSLSQLSNTSGRVPSYRFGSKVRFSHRECEWAGQVVSGAVAYEVSYESKKSGKLRRRWYLDASWSTSKLAGSTPPTLEELWGHPTLGSDFNADHLAVWVIAPDGNPVRCGSEIPFVLKGPSSTRDGHLRSAFSALIALAKQNDCKSITVENLDFADARATGRETMGRGKRGKTFRRIVSGMPTAKMRGLLVGMAANAGLWIIAVDPAYTSAWGAEHWQGYLTTHTKKSVAASERLRKAVSLKQATTLKQVTTLKQATTSIQSTSVQSTSPVTRHLAASVVIGRRGLGHKARMRLKGPGRHQRMAARLPKGVGERFGYGSGVPGSAKREPDSHNGAAQAMYLQQVLVQKTPNPKWSISGDQGAQDRSGHPTGSILTATT